MDKKKIIIKFILIYIVYISLGIPDSIVGTAWPAIRQDFGVPISYGSILTAIVLILAAIASVSYTFIEKHLRTGMIMFFSCLLTMLGLFLVSQSNDFINLCFAVIPMGLGAGAVDATINNFVSKHLQFKHMIWLHGFWGIGAVIGPLSFSISQYLNTSWKTSTLILSIIQLIISFFLFLTISFWDSNEEITNKKESISITKQTTKNNFLIRIFYMFLFSGFDITITLWLSTYIIEKGLTTITDIGFVVGCYYGTIMITRFTLGFIVQRFQLSSIMTFSLTITLFSIGILITTNSLLILILSAISLGVGIASLHPLTLYENHLLYTDDLATQLTSLQIAAGLIGSLLLPALVGILMSTYGNHMFAIVEVSSILLLIVFRYYIVKKDAYNKKEFSSS